MKVSAKQYARSVYDLVSGKTEKESEKIIVNFVDFLHRRGDINRGDEILAELDTLYAEAEGDLTAELASARPLSAEAKKQLTAYLKKKAGAENVRLEEKTEPGLLGGFVIRYDGLVIDGSLKNNLLKFKKQLSNLI